MSDTTGTPAEEVPKPKRRRVVVDTETTGLRDHDIPIEVAWHDIDSGEHGHFIPRHDVDKVRANAHPAALELNGYEQRIAHAAQDVDGIELDRLHRALRGQVLAGSNVRFDARMLAGLFDRWGMVPEPWHYHLGELAPYACGVLGLPLGELPGLAACCELLGVEPGDHTAEADVRATVRCLQVLAEKAGAA